MAKADDYRRGIESCTIRAELAHSIEMKDLWLQMRDSYRHLLQLETSALRATALELLLRPQ